MFGIQISPPPPPSPPPQDVHIMQFYLKALSIILIRKNYQRGTLS